MKKMINVIVGTSLLLGACVPPKVLTSHSFLDSDKSVRTLMQQADDKRLFNVFMRVCDVQGTNVDANCKDTMVLGNVNPGSVY